MRAGPPLFPHTPPIFRVYMSYMKMTELTCQHCNRTFARPTKEAKRNQSRGRRMFCSRSCGGKHLIKEKLGGYRSDVTPLAKWREANPGAASRPRNPFGRVLRSVKARHNHECDLTVEYLISLWDAQRAICPYTGFSMSVPQRHKGHTQDPRMGSLDRIDSSKGYIKGNVEFVCLSVNYAKSTFSRQDMIDFFADIRATQPPVL